MNALLIIEDKNDDYKEIIEFKDINDKNSFSYENEDESCFVEVLEEGLRIKRRLLSHHTNIILDNNPLIEISTLEGTLKFYPKDIAIKKNNDIITIVYTINDTIKELTIKYIGV